MSPEKTRLEFQFFEAKVYSDGQILGAPNDAVKHAEMLIEKYVLNCPIGTGITCSVNLKPQFNDLTQQGWLVEVVEIKKPKVIFTLIRQESLN